MTSFMSKVAVCYFRLSGYKRMTDDPVRCSAYVEKLREINTWRVRPPRRGLKAEVSQETVHGCETYFLNPGRDKVMVYLHGGSYCEQPVIQHWQFCDRIAREAAVTSVMAVYPKAPNNTFTSAYAYLTALWDRLLREWKAEDIVLMGDSSGGGLALAFAEYLRENGRPLPEQLILFSPWLDISMDTPISAKLDRSDPSLSAAALRRMGKNWAGDADVHDYRLSPIYGELRGLPPMTVYYGTHEIFLLDARKFKEKCDREGISLDYIEAPKMNHCYALFPIPEAKRVREEVIARIRG